MSSYKEIAHRSGVSIGTVYRVLHERGRFSPATARRVRTVAEELGYKKNIYASNLSRSRSYEIAVVIPDPAHDNRYWAQPHRGIARAIDALERYRVRRVDFFYDEHDSSSFATQLRAAIDDGADALIIAPSVAAAGERIVSEAELSVPHVLIDSLVPSPDRLGSVAQDSYASGRAAGRLLDLLVPRPEGRIVAARSIPASRHIDERIRGAGDQLFESRGIRPEELDIDFADRDGAMRRILAVADEALPDAFFVSNSNASILADLLVETGVHVPPIVGYDLVPENVRAMKDGTLTFLLSQRPDEQGRLAVEIIHRAVVLGESAGGDHHVPIDIVSAETIESHTQGRRDALLDE